MMIAADKGAVIQYTHHALSTHRAVAATGRSAGAWCRRHVRRACVFVCGVASQCYENSTRILVATCESFVHPADRHSFEGGRASLTFREKPLQEMFVISIATGTVSERGKTTFKALDQVDSSSTRDA